MQRHAKAVIVGGSRGRHTLARIARRHPQQAFRSCLGVLSLGQKYGVVRLEAACARALKYNAVSWSSLQSILKNGLDLEPLTAQRTLDLPEHENLRGALLQKLRHFCFNGPSGCHTLASSRNERNV